MGFGPLKAAYVAGLEERRWVDEIPDSVEIVAGSGGWRVGDDPVAGSSRNRERRGNEEARQIAAGAETGKIDVGDGTRQERSGDSGGIAVDADVDLIGSIGAQQIRQGGQDLADMSVVFWGEGHGVGKADADRRCGSGDQRSIGGVVGVGGGAKIAIDGGQAGGNLCRSMDLGIFGGVHESWAGGASLGEERDGTQKEKAEKRCGCGFHRDAPFRFARA